MNNYCIKRIYPGTVVAATIALVMVGFWLNASSASAASPFGDRDMTSPVDISQAYRLPGIFATDLSITKTGNAITGSFTAFNNEDGNSLSGLQYNIEILGKAGDNTVPGDDTLYDRQANREPFFLGPKEKKQISFTYNLPALPEGDYRFRAQIMTSSGRYLGWDDEPFHVGKEEAAKNFILFGYTAIILQDDSSGELDPLSGPNVNAGETFTLKSYIKNYGANNIIVTPVLETYIFDIARGNGAKETYPAMVLKGGEEKYVNIPMKAAERPEVYETLLTLQSTDGKTISNIAEGRYIVRGRDADLFPIRFEKLGSKKGDEIRMKLDFVGSPDAESRYKGNVTLQIRDERGIVASTAVNGVALSDGITESIAHVILERDIIGPAMVKTTITDENGAMLDEQEVAFPLIILNSQMQAVAVTWISILGIGIILAAIALSLFIMKKYRIFGWVGVVLVLITLVAIGFFGIQLIANAAGNNNGIEVFSPKVFVPETHPGQPVIALFINAPIHDAPAGSYQKSAVPLNYRVTMGVCHNRFAYARVIGRVDYNGNKQSTLAGTNANWKSVHNVVLNGGPFCPPGSPVHHGQAICFDSRDFSGAILVNDLPSTVTSTTLQLVAKWGASGLTTADGAPSDVPDSVVDPADWWFSKQYVHGVNLWLNFGAICSASSDCGTSGYIGSPTCQGSNVYQDYKTFTCNNPGTSTATCSSSVQNQLKTTCATSQACSNGACVAVACSSNSQCGTNGFTGSAFCQGNSIYQNYITWTCNNPGSVNASCTNTTSAQLQNNCWANQSCTNGSCVGNVSQCSDGTDNDGDGKIDSNDPGCHFDLNIYNTASYEPASTNEARSNVGTCSDGFDNNGDGKSDAFDPLCHTDGNANNPGSYDGRRSESGSVACSTNSACGTSGLTGSPFCQGNGVYQNYTTWTCNNAGSTNAYCSSSTSAQLQTTCTGSQTCSSGSCTGSTTTCNPNSYQSCYNGNVYWFNSCGQATTVSQYCTSGVCNGSACGNVISSKTISSFEQARNLSTGNLAWATTVYASPEDILEFKVTMKSSVNQTINNVTVKEIFPWQLLTWAHLTVDGIANAGDITKGVTIGSFAPYQQRIITYQAKLTSASNFSFGTTTLFDPVDVTSTDQGYVAQPTSPVTIIVNRQGATTTPTDVATGVGDDLVNSFIIPLLLVILGFWIWTSKLVPWPRKWARKLLEK